MADVEEQSGDKEENKPPSPKPDQDEVAPPLIQKGELWESFEIENGNAIYQLGSFVFYRSSPPTR